MMRTTRTAPSRFNDARFMKCSPTPEKIKLNNQNRLLIDLSTSPVYFKPGCGCRLWMSVESSLSGSVQQEDGQLTVR